MNAIIIARVSTEEQKEAGNSLPAQIARLERYCQNKGFKIIKTCSFDESAYTDQRNEFDLIIDFILAQKEKVAVCCDKVDRLSRNMFDKRISALYDRALEDKIELHFASDGQIITSRISATEKFQFGINLGLAKYYSDAISDNVKRAREQLLRSGTWPSRAPFGYKNIRENGKDGKCDIIISEHEASIIKTTFNLYSTGAYSMNLLVEKINKDFDLKWSKGFLDYVLNNTFYHGVMVCKGISYPHRYPPIITKNIFDEVQKIKAGFQKKKFKYAGKPYIYRGLISCATCGLAITPEKHKGHVYYHCTQYNGKHDAAWIREEDLTKQFVHFFKRLHIPENIRQELITTLSEVHHNKMDFHNKKHKELTKEHTTLTTMMDNLYLDKLKGRINETQYDNFYQKFRSQMDSISNRLAQLQYAEDNYYITAKYILEITNKAHDLFVSSEVDEKRQLLKFLLQNLKLDGKNIVYDVQKPFNLIVEAFDSQTWCARLDSNQ